MSLKMKAELFATIQSLYLEVVRSSGWVIYKEQKIFLSLSKFCEKMTTYFTLRNVNYSAEEFFLFS